MIATGGYDGTNFLSSIECYNVAEDRWTEEGNMACGRSGHGIAVGAEPSHEYVGIYNSGAVACFFLFLELGETLCYIFFTLADLCLIFDLLT